MMGQGLRPESYNPLADTLTSNEVRDYLKNLNTIMQATVQRLQPYPEFIEAIG